MPTIERPTYTFSFTLLLVLCALACFVASWQEWVTAGAIFGTLAKLF